MAVKNYTYIDVVDTAIVCNLDIKQSTLDNPEVAARCPYCDDYKYRMFLSRKADKATFWCHNCGATGSAATLYADFNPSGRRMTVYEAYKELLNHPHVRTENFYCGGNEGDKIKEIGERSQIYLSMLNLLDLEEKHYTNLHNRGLSDEIIEGNMYRSVPTDYRKRRQLANKLSEWFDLSGMPGFYTKNFRWELSNCSNSGILIPVCDKDNNIQGLQIRYDELPPKVITNPDGTKVQKKGDRFRWFSTGGSYYENGTGISSYIHIAGDTSCETLHITEGPLKADVASFLSDGELFIGLTGVQNVRYLEGVIKDLKPKRILECIDMDCATCSVA